MSALRLPDLDVWESVSYHALQPAHLRPDLDGRYLIDDRLHEFWENAVRNFSGRAFTLPQDRLFALAGVAEEIMAIDPSQRYLAGLWESCLLRQLFWEIPEYPRKPVIQETGAPSWSWASVMHSVNLNPTKDEHLVYWKEHATFVSCEITPATTVGPLGDVLKGRLVLHGVVGWHGLGENMDLWDSMHPQNREDWRANWRSFSKNLHTRLATDVSGKAKNFEYQDDDDKITFAWLLIGHYDYFSNHNELGLILKPADDSTFTRVGSFQVMTKYKERIWGRDSVDRTVVIC
jgi:hypothetical protein